MVASWQFQTSDLDDCGMHFRWGVDRYLPCEESSAISTALSVSLYGAQ